MDEFIEITRDNPFWYILIGGILFISIIRVITGRSNLMRSIYEQKIELTPTVNIEDTLLEIMKNSGFRNLNHKNSENKINGTVPFSMSSWSEIIEVKWLIIDDKLEIHFKSVCMWPYQIYDWGKNKENFKKFEKELSKMIYK